VSRRRHAAARRAPRSVAAAVRALWGTALLVAPGRVVRATGAEPDARVRVVARVLAVRHLAQASVLATSTSPRVHRSSAAVDASHGLSMVALAVVDRSRRRPAFLSAAVATAFAVAGLRPSRD